MFLAQSDGVAVRLRPGEEVDGLPNVVVVLILLRQTVTRRTVARLVADGRRLRGKNMVISVIELS